MTKGGDYKWIERWGAMLGSGSAHVTTMQRAAAIDDAPVNAIFRDHDTGQWNVINDVNNRHTLYILGQMFPDTKAELDVIIDGLLDYGTVSAADLAVGDIVLVTDDTGRKKPYVIQEFNTFNNKPNSFVGVTLNRGKGFVPFFWGWGRDEQVEVAQRSTESR